jgi:hypothetical protein
MVSCGAGDSQDAAKDVSRHRMGIGSSFFVDSEDPHASDTGPGTEAVPWQTLVPLDNRKFDPGATIFFARGSSYTGGVTLSSWGEKGKEITLTPYGKGDAPLFTSDDYATLHGNVFHLTGGHTVIEGLHFKQTPNAPDMAEDVDILQVGAVFVAVGADYVAVQSNEFEDTPIGVNFLGRNGTIRYNYIHDTSRFLSSPDWGPLGIVVGNSFVEVANNRCENIVAVGGNYGGDGGCIEVDDRYYGAKAHDISIHHNHSVGNMGFLEVEGQNAGSNIDVAYNFSDDHQEFIFFWGGEKSKIENNTVIRTRPSLNGAVNTVFTMRGAGFEARNNIFVVANNIQVWVTAPYGAGAGYGSTLRENNLYFCSDGCSDPAGLPLGPGELIGDPDFLDESGGDYCLGPSSLAADAGQDLGYATDLLLGDVPRGAAPDLGAYECN